MSRKELSRKKMSPKDQLGLDMKETKSIEVQEKVLQTLASITKVSAQNRTMLAQTDNAIPTLASLTNSSSPIIQTLSLLTLFNLSLNPDLKQSLADMETSTSSLESSKLVSSLICSLAMHDKNKAKFGVAGTIQLLVETAFWPCELGQFQCYSGLQRALIMRTWLELLLLFLVSLRGLRKG
ncbi:U-box domain-containing protein 12 [Glycine soja]